VILSCIGADCKWEQPIGVPAITPIGCLMMTTQVIADWKAHHPEREFKRADCKPALAIDI